MRPLQVWILVTLLLGLLIAPTGAQEAAPVPPDATAPGPSTAPAPLDPGVDGSAVPAEGVATEPVTAPATAPAAPASQAAPATGATATEPATAPATEPSGIERTDGGILLSFREASLQAVLEQLSEATGLIVVQDTPVEGRVTVVSRQPLDRDEAVSLLNTVLKDRQLAAVRTGRTLRIVPLAQAKLVSVPVRSGADPAQIGDGDEIITQVIPIRFADATQLRSDLASLIPAYADLSANASSNTLVLTDTRSNIRRIVEIVAAMDQQLSAASDVKVFQLRYATASSVARMINEVFATEGQAGTRAPQRDFRTMRGPGGMPGMPGQGEGEAGGARAQPVTASADDRTNTVVVTAPPDLLPIVESVVAELDANPVEEPVVFVYSVRNGQATNLESVLNSLFSRSATGTTSATGARTTAAGTTPGRTTAGTTAARGGQQTTNGGRFAGRTPSATALQTASDLSNQVYFVANEDTNSLLVLTAPTNYPRVKAILDELDRPAPQVLIKVLIAEVTHSDALDLGAEFSILNLRASGFGSQVFTDFDVAAAQGGLVYKLVEADVNVALRALAQVGKLDVLSRPYILASDNQPASMTIGQSVPFIRNTRVTETGQTINTVEYEDIGIILEATAHINPDGLVILDIAPEISALTGETVPISETVRAPVFALRSAQSRVAIRDGQTIVIGGLMEDRYTRSVDKVPLLGDIPLIGLAFQRQITRKSKTELLIFLTPHVAMEPDVLQGMTDQEREAAELVPQAVQSQAFEEHLRGMERGASTRPGVDAQGRPYDRSSIPLPLPTSRRPAGPGGVYEPEGPVEPGGEPVEPGPEMEPGPGPQYGPDVDPGYDPGYAPGFAEPLPPMEFGNGGEIP